MNTNQKCSNLINSPKNNHQLNNNKINLRKTLKTENNNIK